MARLNDVRFSHRLPGFDLIAQADDIEDNPVAIIVTVRDLELKDSMVSDASRALLYKLHGRIETEIRGNLTRLTWPM